MYILGIDSSSGRVSIAVNRDQQLLSKVEYGKNQKYMVSIISLIDKALKKANISLDSVDLFGVSTGPGDFTGTRIGISIAKTLAWVRSKPICGVESLDITALGIFFKNLKKIQKLLGERKHIVIAPVLDVKRSEIFFSFFKVEESSLDITAADQKKYCSKDGYSGFKIHTVSNITVQNKNYLINKFSGDYLSESKDFTKKFKELFFSVSGFSSSILLGGSGFNSYENLESAFYLNLCAYYSFLKNRQPDYNLGDYGLAPLYVREFTPFKTSKAG